MPVQGLFTPLPETLEAIAQTLKHQATAIFAVELRLEIFSPPQRSKPSAYPQHTFPPSGQKKDGASTLHRCILEAETAQLQVMLPWT